MTRTFQVEAPIIHSQNNSAIHVEPEWNCSIQTMRKTSEDLANETKVQETQDDAMK